jgi:hypothetical protein
MATQGERQNYNWRPNDNSIKTNLRYDLEMNHWLKSMKSSSSGNGSGVSGNWGATFAVIGLILNFLVIAIWFILILISDLIVWIVNLFNTPKEEVITPVSTKWKPSKFTGTVEEMEKMWNESTKVDIYKDNPN